eukprot:snap_masked-scaffold_11-processed-gene-9.28-mRNA-1 protein AED:1.00 eAED:1.00 QI:0/0/0/0/1/1/2/0/68
MPLLDGYASIVFEGFPLYCYGTKEKGKKVEFSNLGNRLYMQWDNARTQILQASWYRNYSLIYTLQKYN